MFSLKNKFENIYRATRDSFKMNILIQKCENQGPFVIIALSKEHKKIFGAYTDICPK